MNVGHRYRLRLQRKRALLRARVKRSEVRPVRLQTDRIQEGDVLLFGTLRNEAPRLPYFLDYYRALGVSHFLLIDNGSSDGTADLLAQQSDVSLWYTGQSYRRARYGLDWINGLLRRYGHDHWCLTVDADELLVYPFCDTRPLPALTNWLEGAGRRAFGAMLLDLYPKGPIEAVTYRPGQDPVKLAPWFDAGNYTIQRNPLWGNLWIQGGPRARVFFAHQPEAAPALNKIPLVKWHRSYSYISSTHMLLPRALNKVYEDRGGERASGALLHTKFLSDFGAKARQEMARHEHHAKSAEYRAYARKADSALTLWCEGSTQYAGWPQLEALGLISTGHWA